MNMRHLKYFLILGIFSIVISGCSPNQLLGPASTPTLPPTTGTVSGWVYHSDGITLFESALVILQTEDSSFLLNTRTDSTGKYIFENVKPGQYIVAAGEDKEGGCLVEGSTKVEAGKESIVNLKGC